MPISDQTREGGLLLVLGMGSAAPRAPGLGGEDECLSKTGVLLGQRKVGLHPVSVLCPLQLPTGTQTYLS